MLQALPITHCALVLIHPFREGNGRVSRLLSTLMALHAGMRRNYAPMEEIFWRVVAASN